MPHTLVLLRHGNSEWNQKNLFTGWVDVRLSELNIPTGIPLVYRLGDDFMPLGPGEYLDPEAAAAGAAAVAAQGKK